MFVHFGIKDVIDILLVALLLYNIYKMMKDSGTINIFGGIMAFSCCLDCGDQNTGHASYGCNYG